jgi:hypothetical protein
MPTTPTSVSTDPINVVTGPVLEMPRRTSSPPPTTVADPATVPLIIATMAEIVAADRRKPSAYTTMLSVITGISNVHASSTSASGLPSSTLIVRMTAIDW